MVEEGAVPPLVAVLTADKDVSTDDVLYATLVLRDLAADPIGKERIRAAGGVYAIVEARGCRYGGRYFESVAKQALSALR